MKQLTLIIALFTVGLVFAQQPKTREIKFKTSAVCEMCKERIENELNYTKGVVFAELDVETKMLTVKFKTKHLNTREVKKIVAGLGYDAGDIARDEEAFKELPLCCRAEGHCERD